MIFDLHSHSTASDGVLSPAMLVERARTQGVGVLALTDHDELRGQAEAAAAASAAGLRYVTGVEVSVTWGGHTVHIVGLHVDPQEPTLLAGLAANRAGRAERARRMAAELARLGIEGALEGAYARAVNPDLIGRTHFARFLVEEGHVKDVKTVFQKYLVKGRPGYVPHEWASLSAAIGWIRAAGGQAVLAHPGRYPFGREKMHLLVQEFRDLGGVAIEVVTGSHSEDQVPQYAALAQEYGLYASVGSDFHAPGEGGRELGRLRPLPEGCRPLWQTW
ncbi:MAG: PHP domain-containing protein [Thiobacillaceae bacterium]|nr:PHP domain-containing protein [Thiobacillaceae bacterium]MCX7673950.1 PHP domain-containing protein [Thiobacillaceae bacterium]MDW8322822.1 3',5'-nucleoside bisphosphate phosphatase [Burkholderiales bacterium]